MNLTFLSSLSILAHCALLERAEKGFSFFVILRRSLDFLMSSCCTDVKETGYLTVLLLCVHPPGQKMLSLIHYLACHITQIAKQENHFQIIWISLQNLSHRINKFQLETAYQQYMIRKRGGESLYYRDWVWDIVGGIILIGCGHCKERAHLPLLRSVTWNLFPFVQVSESLSFISISLFLSMHPNELNIILKYGRKLMRKNECNAHLSGCFYHLFLFPASTSGALILTAKFG